MNPKLLRLTLGLLLPILSGATASAQLLAHDDAAAYNALGNTWTNGMNLGFGFAPWTLRTTNVGGFSGFFIGDGGTIATTGNSAWGLYGNNTATNPPGNAAVAYRGFTNGLPANAIFRIKWRNTGIGGDANPPFHQGGFSLRNGNANASVDDYLNGSRLAFYYFGGVDDNFRIQDGGFDSPLVTGLGFGNQGFPVHFQIEVILLTADTYRLVVKNPTTGVVITNFDNRPLAGSGTIDSAAIYNFQCDGNQDFNSMEISTVSLLAPDIQDVSPAGGSAYVPSASAISFNVSSPFSGVASNNISLSLNGTNVTGLSFSGSNAFWSVTKSGALADNRVYTAQVIATDVNGNKATNTFTFNTWTANNFFVEAEAYNYSAGGYIPSPQPGQYDTLAGVAGSNGVDFLEFDDAGTNGYRPLDAVDLERSGDLLDHAGYAGFPLENWALSFVQSGEWLNYTRRTSNTTYNVYARMSAGGNQPVMLMERLANPTALTSNQPLAALGTFVGTNTSDIVSNFTFVPLKDFFSSNVLVRFSTSSLTTNTFRLSRIGDGYNFDYLIFVPSTDASTMRPYLATGFPFPNAANVSPDQKITVNIANRQTTVLTSSIQLFVNNVNVTGGITTSSNAAGTTVSYTPTAYYPPGSNSTVSIVFTDSGSVTQTNNWQFSVANVPTVPTSFALATVGANRGFNLHIAKAPNEAPASQFPPSSARAEAHLANLIINTNTGLPWTNEAGGPLSNGRYAETNVINYNQVVEFGSAGTFTNDTLFPYILPTLDGSYTNDPNNFSLESIAYAQLSPGIYRWAVRSDDGFRLTFGTGAKPTNLLIGSFEGGRNDATASEFEFIIQTNGLYPFRLLYYEGNGFANVELYSINRANGQPTLINDLTNGAAIVTYREVPVVLLNPAHSGNTSTFSFATQAGRTHTVEYKNALTNGPWQTLTVVNGTGATTNITDATANLASRFYRVSTQ